MRYIGGLVVWILAVLAFRWSAGEIAIQKFGAETRARVTSVSRSSSLRTSSSYTAHYEFETEDMSRGRGTCPTHKGTEGGSQRIRYLRQDPSFNTPAVGWYANLCALGFGAAAWPLALWSARILLQTRRRRSPGDQPEQESGSAAAPAPGAIPVPPAGKASTAFLFSLALSAAAIAVNLAWFQNREQAMKQRTLGTLPPPPALDGDALPPPPALDAPKPAPATASPALPRGASVGNVANGSHLGFDGDALYNGLWRDFNNPNAPTPGLYRFALDGSGRTPVGKPDDTERIFRGIQIKDEWIYYISMDGISRIRKDGTKNRSLTKKRVSSMAVVGDWVYYQFEAIENAIYRMHLDGGAEKQLCKESVGAMCVTDDGMIYYVNKTDEGRLWRMKGDGSDRARLSNRHAYKLLVAEGSIWFSDLDRKSALCRMDLAGNNAEVVTEDGVFGINVAEGLVYFVRQTGELARCKPDGSELEVIAPKAADVFINGNFIYFRPDIEDKTFRRCQLDGSNPIDIRF